jgi:4-hydroxybenzoate polyprenyltransferase
VSVREALLLGAGLALLAFVLVLTTNPTTIAWSFLGLFVTLLYPYAKRHVSMPQAVLGVAFSFGIPMAFSAVQGGALSWTAMGQSAPMLAWAMLVGNLFWVLAYDTEYAMVDRDDDVRIGMKTSAITLGQHDVQAVAGFYALYLLSWWGLLRDQQLGWPFLTGLLCAALQALWHVGLIRDRQREACFLAFRMNHWLGATVFAGVVTGYALRG